MSGTRDADVVRTLVAHANGDPVKIVPRLLKDARRLAERLEGKPRDDGEARHRRNRLKYGRNVA